MSQANTRDTVRKSTIRNTYLGDLVEAEFHRLEAYRQEHPEYVIMPKDIAANTGLHDGTVRRILRERDLWTQEYKDAAKRETLRRINVSKRERGYPSLKKQAQAGWPNLARGREKLAEIHRLGVEAAQHAHETEVEATND